jgi:type VI secretion system protein ImpG
MNREFLDIYNRELRLLKEQGKAFAEEYPGIAERLGGLIDGQTDPMIMGLLEGTAFLAARVQLKIKHEFPEFTNNLIEQLAPNYLAPTPSSLLLKVKPSFGDKALREGRLISAGSYVDSNYRQLDRSIACRFRLCDDVELWPFDLPVAEYLQSTAQLQALGIPVGGDIQAGLRVTLRHRSTARVQDEPSDANKEDIKPEMLVAGCRIRSLPVYLLGSEADAVALYEQIFARCRGIFVRWLDTFGDPVVVRLPIRNLVEIGFERESSLFPKDHRVFAGFDLLREYFAFPRKFLGFKVTGLHQILDRVNARSFEIALVFDEVNSKLAAAVQPSMFALYSAPAINLFEKSTDRIPVSSGQHEYHVIPDRSRYLDYECHRILEVYAHFRGSHDKVPVGPLYSTSLEVPQKHALYYTARRLPRRRTVEEKRSGISSDYVGTDTFISISQLGGEDETDSPTELSLRALCSNRHLTEHLPVGVGGADFQLLDDVSLEVDCVSGPTQPGEAVVSQQRGRSEIASTGVVCWRLINMLCTNHLGLVERGSVASALALREILAMFANLSDGASERRIQGVRSVDSRPIVRRVHHRSGTGAARGIEITVTIDEKAYEGTGIFLLGSVLDRFFAEYAAFNHFTQTVLRSTERGEIMRWPPRMGARAAL